MHDQKEKKVKISNCWILFLIIILKLCSFGINKLIKVKNNN